MTPAQFDLLQTDLFSSLRGKELFVQDCFAGADPTYRLPIRVINELAWHNLFARNMFLQESDPGQLAQHQPQFTVIDAPGFNASPEDDGTRSEAFILLHFGRREVIVGGTAYAGEMKKSMFTVMNYLLLSQGVMTM